MIINDYWKRSWSNVIIIIVCFMFVCLMVTHKSNVFCLFVCLLSISIYRTIEPEQMFLFRSKKNYQNHQKWKQPKTKKRKQFCYQIRKKKRYGKVKDLFDSLITFFCCCFSLVNSIRFVLFINHIHQSIYVMRWSFR